MRRSTPLTRTAELRGSVEQARAWERRTRERMLRRRRERAGAEGPLSPRAWRVAVFEASGGACIVTGARARDAFDRRFHAHHPLEKALLPPACRWDPRNGVLVTRRVHMEHTASLPPIAGEVLPASVWEFAAEMDRLRPGTSWATETVRRAHP